MDLNRAYIGVRVGFVLLCVACYFATLAALAYAPTLDQAGTVGALEWLIGTIGVAVAGDSIRPSGTTRSIFHAPAAGASPAGAPPADPAAS